MNEHAGFLKPIAFATCSYLKSRPGDRAPMVFGAISSWKDMLDLPFAEKIFLDDRSPQCGALRLLASTNLLEKFTRAEYCATAHPAHCNFGYIGAVQLATTPYVLHLDDDVYVTGSRQQCKEIIDLAIRVMEEDRTIMGFNLLNLDPSFHAKEFLPGEAYRKDLGLYHPRKLFGNAVSIIRRDILERIPYSLLLERGENQLGGWENEVSVNTREFLVGDRPTPFEVESTSYFFSSTSEISRRGRVAYLVRAKVRKLLGRIRKTPKSSTAA